MMARILDLLFGCSHQNYTFPQSAGNGHYVCCLECGKEFEYDWNAMRITGERKQRPVFVQQEWTRDAEEVLRQHEIQRLERMYRL